MSYKIEVENIYTVCLGEKIELVNKFNKELVRDNGVQYFHIDMIIDNKIYNIKNIPIILTEMDNLELTRYFGKLILRDKIKEGIFDYERYLLEE